MPTAQDLENYEWLAANYPFWRENYGKIVNKQRKLVEFIPNPGQLAQDEAVEGQRAENKPIRVINLKARQIGFSTDIQGRLIHKATTTPNYHTAVVAHDKETSKKLYRIGERFYGNLPDGIKPDLASHRRGLFLHFGERGDKWQRGGMWPDSTYYVDTANETEAGRGGTFSAIHASECAFWADFTTKMTALQDAVPDEPETMFFLETTANGHNEFKDFWDASYAGETDYVALFWPWWKEPTYALPFANDDERERFVVGQGKAGEDEFELVEKYDLSPEQLNWRRKKIKNYAGDGVSRFKQENPSYPEEAFLTTGVRVFSAATISSILVHTELSDPRNPSEEHPGPELGTLRAARSAIVGGQAGKVERPEEPEWEPDPRGNWKLWHPRSKPIYEPDPEDRFVIGVDVSGGEHANTVEPAWHAIEVINHETREQVAEYASRTDIPSLTQQVYLAALFWNNAWLGVEITGSWGQPVIRAIAQDFGYPFAYYRTQLHTRGERESDAFGWDTNSKTKPILEATANLLLEDGSLEAAEGHGIKSDTLAHEMLTYVKDENGRSGPEPGKFSDRLMAWMIAQQIAQEMPIRRPRTVKPGAGWRPQNAVAGY